MGKAKKRRSGAGKRSNPLGGSFVVFLTFVLHVLFLKWPHLVPVWFASSLGGHRILILLNIRPSNWIPGTRSFEKMVLDIPVPVRILLTC